MIQLVWRSKKTRFLIFSISRGMDPLSWLEARLSEVKLVRWPNDEGMAQ